MRILYVEDEQLLADAVTHLLKKADINVDWVADGEEGLRLAKKPIYDAIVLDIMLPKMSGLEILEIIRKQGIKTPVIMLSALSEVEDKVKGLEIGADDYLAKPFKTKELIARLQALTRRPALCDTKTLQFADLTLDLENRTVNGLPLTEKEASILEMLMKAGDKTVQKDYILAHVWGADMVAEDNYVEVYMSYLRKKLKETGSKVEIKTVRGLGYKLMIK
ncbi:response regulator transcription factor [Candidatus Saccharibacteria bacterium]|nr:response regulator transcription factor [Candidatus Saccharibacteria bacterium]MBR6122812.1 response regulator transcription factor [Candidatus Saccharibacteria bacterium]